MTEEESRYSFPFINQYVRVPKQVSDAVGVGCPEESGGVRHCVGLIVVNLLARGEVAYSRNSNFYTGHRTALYTRTNMRRAVEVASYLGYAVESRAGFWDRRFERGLSSTLAPGPRLSEIGPTPELELDTGSLPLLVVDGKQVFDTDGLASVVGSHSPTSPESLALMRRLPEVLDEALRLNRGYWNRTEVGTGNLAEGSACVRQVGLTRIFKDGGVGRWFQKGGLSYQQLPKADRARLTLGGEEVAELDYPAMHPHILYAWEGRQCPDGFYERVTALCGCTRPVAKQVTLMAVNAGSYRELVSAVNFGKRREPAPTLYDELRRLRLTAGDVVEALARAHPALERYVYSGLATRLMLAESDIMTSALLRLVELGIPALPVHDSAIVPLRHGEAAGRVMEDEYRRQTGFDIAVAPAAPKRSNGRPKRTL